MTLIWGPTSRKKLSRLDLCLTILSTMCSCTLILCVLIQLGTKSRILADFVTVIVQIMIPIFSTDCSLCRLIRAQNILSADTDISRQTECHSFFAHLISESVSVTPSFVIESSICSVLCLYDSCESIYDQPALWTRGCNRKKFGSLKIIVFLIQFSLSEAPYSCSAVWVPVIILLATHLYDQINSLFYSLQTWRWKQHVPSKHLCPPTALHCDFIQKTIILTRKWRLHW
jgi:hypothetical protein